MVSPKTVFVSPRLGTCQMLSTVEVGEGVLSLSPKGEGWGEGKVQPSTPPTRKECLPDLLMRWV